MVEYAVDTAVLTLAGHVLDSVVQGKKTKILDLNEVFGTDD